MSMTLLQCVAECFQGSGSLEGMHCLGAVSGADSASPSGVSSRGGVMSVVRALGVLVCEGRIQGPPRGYKEGPHCAPPLQAPANDHMCEKDNYLCGRYLVLVREIAERIAIGSSLCVEVVMCSDCPCGLARSTCKDPVSLVSSTAISQWQHPSDILLEYWYMEVVPSKSPEMMNSQSLYQAVRSRLHFSQVAAWWSRSNGTKPSYVMTRIGSYNEDSLRKFRESPTKHTFPLAGVGDGNSIQITVWALPRMEEVPTLNCPVHPIKDNEEECVARALTPTKNGPVPSSSHATDTLVLPVLVDDRLQTPCDKPGKHHCHCEDEEGCPPSPSIRPNGERKRRRSLPCGPSEPGPSVPFGVVPLPSLQETITSDSRDSSQLPNYSRYSDSPNYASRNHRAEHEQSQRSEASAGYESHSYLSTGSLERSFRTQVSLEEQQEGNEEKRYKPSNEISENNENEAKAPENSLSAPLPLENSYDRSLRSNPDEIRPEKSENRQSSTTTLNERASRRYPNNLFHKLRAASRDPNLVINPFADRSCFHEPNPGPSSYVLDARKTVSPPSPPCTVHHNYSRASRASAAAGRATTTSDTLVGDDVVKNCFASGKDLSHLMSKLSFPKEKPNAPAKPREEGGLFDWFSKVPGRVLSAPTGLVPDAKPSPKPEEKPKQQQEAKNSEVKLKNCNLELSQREFDEVLAVLRSRTPSGRRRTPVKTVRRRDRSERNSNDNSKISDSSDSCVCPIHREVRRNTAESCVCRFCKNLDKSTSSNEQRCCVYRCQSGFSKMEESAEETRESTMINVGKSTERLENVSNKADVLLGAILRTHERKGLSDISNGTRPRTGCLSTEKYESSSDDGNTSSPRNIPLEDDRSLPSVLNKRLNRFKQLFKKEWEKREASTKDEPSKNSFSDYPADVARAVKIGARKDREEPNGERNSRESRIKRKIEFTNIHAGIGKSEDNYEEIVNSAISETHQNSTLYNSTNCYKSKDSNERKVWVGDESIGRADVDMWNSSNHVDRINSRDSCFDKGDASSTLALTNGSLCPRSRKMDEDLGSEFEEDETSEKGVPSAIEQEQFRRSLENAASMVFHSRTGLPLTSSPAPLRRGHCCFDYDSSLNSVSSKRSALFELNTPPSPGAVSLEETDREIENSCEGEETPKRTSTARSRPQSHALLGSFEESALNGRLEPVSTVHGFTAELGASGSFCPKHRKLPVTVFFYTLGDNDKVSTPYLAHINLGKKGYQVPRSGTIQVTLLNPLGTVVKMFVVLYDLSDMPPRSHTFLRQRTLRDKTLRYLVHLRFMSGKSGRIYLHTDIRMIICRKSDVDTASDFGSEPPKELRSYIHGPTNPKFSPRC